MIRTNPIARPQTTATARRAGPEAAVRLPSVRAGLLGFAGNLSM